MAPDGTEQIRRWQELANMAAEESDPEKLSKIVKDLCSLLDAEKKPPANSPARADQSQKSAGK